MQLMRLLLLIVYISWTTGAKDLQGCASSFQ